MDNENINCGMCLFCKDRTTGEGECRRYAPNHFGTYYSFPIVILDNTWCGEFKPRNEQNEKFLAEGGELITAFVGKGVD